MVYLLSFETHFSSCLYRLLIYLWLYRLNTLENSIKFFHWLSDSKPCSYYILILEFSWSTLCQWPITCIQFLFLCILKYQVHWNRHLSPDVVKKCWSRVTSSLELKQKQVRWITPQLTLPLFILSSKGMRFLLLFYHVGYSFQSPDTTSQKLCSLMLKMVSYKATELKFQFSYLRSVWTRVMLFRNRDHWNISGSLLCRDQLCKNYGMKKRMFVPWSR